MTTIPSATRLESAGARVSADGIGAVSYDLVEPLDWYQLKTLMWRALPLLSDGSAAARWNRVAELVNGNCPESAPCSGEDCARVFETIATAKPALRRVASEPEIGQRIWVEILYENAQRLFGRPAFMNLGYAPPADDTRRLELAAADEPFRLFVALYERVIGGLDLEGRRILEVGCGGGGGSSWVVRHHRPGRLIGIDPVAANVDTCRSRHRLPGLEFRIGRGERLDFPAESFDVVVNIESSEHYLDIPAFFAEVARVLRPGGHFLFGDVRWRSARWGRERTVESLQRQILDAELRIRSSEEITAPVLESVRLQAAPKRELLEQCALGANALKHFREILLCEGSGLWRQLAARELQYWVVQARKPRPGSVHRAGSEAGRAARAATGKAGAQ